jgi:hypothetical protein
LPIAAYRPEINRLPDDLTVACDEGISGIVNHDLIRPRGPVQVCNVTVNTAHDICDLCITYAVFENTSAFPNTVVTAKNAVECNKGHVVRVIARDIEVDPTGSAQREVVVEDFLGGTRLTHANEFAMCAVPNAHFSELVIVLGASAGCCKLFHFRIAQRRVYGSYDFRTLRRQLTSR